MSKENNLHEKELKKLELQIYPEILDKIKNKEKVDCYLSRFKPSRRRRYQDYGIEFEPYSYGDVLGLKDKLDQLIKDFPNDFFAIVDKSIYKKYLGEVKKIIQNKIEEGIGEITKLIEGIPTVAVELDKKAGYTIQIKTSEAVKDVDLETKKGVQFEKDKKGKPIKKKATWNNIQEAKRIANLWKNHGKNLEYQMEKAGEQFKDKKPATIRTWITGKFYKDFNNK